MKAAAIEIDRKVDSVGKKVDSGFQVRTMQNLLSREDRRVDTFNFCSE